MNYAELTSLIEQYTENDEATFVANIPTFVRLAEERIYRLVKLPKLRKVITSLVTAANQMAVALPSDFLSVDYLQIITPITNAYTSLLAKDPSFINEAYPINTVTGKPVYYALRDNQTILLGPVPDQIYSINMAYMYKPASIVTDGANWIGDNASMALLYGSLVEAYTYMKGEDSLMQMYEQRFMEGVDRAKRLGEGKDRVDEYRNPPPIAPLN